MTNIEWADWLIVAAAVLTACGVIWRKFLRPLLRALDTATEVLPVLVVIAQEFQPNHGTSLRDAIDRIERKADTANDLAAGAVVSVEKAATAAQLAASMSEANGSKLEKVASQLEEHVRATDPLRAALVRDFAQRGIDPTET